MKRKIVIQSVVALMVFNLVGIAAAVPVVFFDTADPFVVAGETISINIFSTVETDRIRMDRISDDGGGIADNLWINPDYDPPLNEGTLINENGVLIEGVSNAITPNFPAVTGILYSFDYTVSEDVVNSQLITIFADSSGGAINYVFCDLPLGQDPYVTPQSLSLMVVPEPVTIVLLGLGSLLLRRKNRQ